MDFPALFAELRRGGLEGGPLMIEWSSPAIPPKRSKNQESQAIRGAVDRRCLTASPRNQECITPNKELRPCMTRAAHFLHDAIDRCGRWRRRHTLKPKTTAIGGSGSRSGNLRTRLMARGRERVLDYGDKYSGGLGTYTAKHLPLAIYAPRRRGTSSATAGRREGSVPLQHDLLL